MSPSHKRMSSQKMYANNLGTEQNYEELNPKYEEFNEIYQKPIKLMQTYTDGHLGTYAPSNQNFYHSNNFF